MMVGIISCHSIAKVDASMVIFRTIAAIRYTGFTFLYHAESAYAGILTCVLDPFGGLILRLCKSWGNQFE